MKKLNKILSVGLSLALCAGMVAPAFAEEAENMDVYYYLSLTNDQVAAIMATMEEGVNVRGELGLDKQNYIFVGKEQASKDADGKVVVNAPDESQEIAGWYNDDTKRTPDVTVETNPHGSLGAYEYDDGTAGIDEVGQYTYTENWDDVEASPVYGATATDSEGARVVLITSEGSQENTYHADGTVELTQNNTLKVVIKDYNQNEEDFANNDGKYYRASANVADLAVKGALDALVADKELDEEFYDVTDVNSTDDHQFIRTYTEKTYTVTISASEALAFDGMEANTYGKAHGHGEVAALDSRYVPGVGTYTFGGWEETIDDDGNYTYTARVNFIPEYIDFGTTTIDDPTVPLAAGPVTRAEFVDYLWRHENEPASDGVCTFTDVAEDHDYVLALAWAEQNGIIEANEDGAFEPDELVTVAAVREFLGNFARVFGMDVDVYALATLTGDDDEAVLNCDEVLAEFFGEEYVSAEDAAA